MRLPDERTPAEEVLRELRDLSGDDADWQRGRTWSLVYPSSAEVDEVALRAHDQYLFTNALNPFAFPSLRRMESEVVAMTADLLHAPDGFRGSLHSGGSESILLAVKTARDRARAERDISEPELVAPLSAHPAFNKAAHFLGLRVVHSPLGDDYRADPRAFTEALGPRTALAVGSAPCYPFGVVDPLSEMSEAAAEREVPFHVDACLGGFLLPFWEAIGAGAAPFDFRITDVTSISADVHKYGYAPKGASVLLHRDGEHGRHQAFRYDGWPGGVYGTRGVAGARGGGPIAAAWAVMRHLGREGYTAFALQVQEATRILRAGIDATPGLRVLGDPDMSVLAFVSEEADAFALGDAMQELGWRLDRQQLPDALHLMVSPSHVRVVDEFLEDLRSCAAAARGRSGGRSATYAD